MVTPELKAYINSELERGVSKEDLGKALKDAGWAGIDIEHVLGLSEAAASVVEDFSFDPNPSDNKFDVIKGKAAALIQNIKSKFKLDRFQLPANMRLPWKKEPTGAALTDSGPSTNAAESHPKLHWKENLKLQWERIPNKKITVPLAAFLFVGGAAAIGFFSMKSAEEMPVPNPAHAPGGAATSIADRPLAQTPAKVEAPKPEAAKPAAQRAAAKSDIKSDAGNERANEPAKTPASTQLGADVAAQEQDPSSSSSEDKAARGNPNVDTDGDGLDDEMESMLGTHPRKQDTDGDGVKDGVEVKRGEDPTSRY